MRYFGNMKMQDLSVHKHTVGNYSRYTASGVACGYSDVLYVDITNPALFGKDNGESNVNDRWAHAVKTILYTFNNGDYLWFLGLDSQRSPKTHYGYLVAHRNGDPEVTTYAELFSGSCLDKTIADMSNICTSRYIDQCLANNQKCLWCVAFAFWEITDDDDVKRIQYIHKSGFSWNAYSYTSGSAKLQTTIQSYDMGTWSDGEYDAPKEPITSGYILTTNLSEDSSIKTNEWHWERTLVCDSILSNRENDFGEAWDIISSHFNTTGEDGNWNEDVYDRITPDPDYNPYAGGGESATGGGNGTFDYTSEIIDVPTVPNVSMVDSGFVTVYNPTTSQLAEIAQYIWSTDTLQTIIKNVYGNPIDAIMGLSLVPFTIPNKTMQDFKIAMNNTNIMVNMPATQYVTVDCGTIHISEFTGSALDYSPYTKAQIYLPYIGCKEINIDEIMGQDVQVIYNCEITTGACVAFIRVNSSVLYQFSGQCSQQIPISNMDMSNAINTAITVVGTAGLMAANASSPVAPNPQTKSGVQAGLGKVGEIVSSSASIGGATQIANAVMGSKPVIGHTGSLGGVSGLLAYQKPFMIITAPRQSLPSDYQNLAGLPSNITSQLAKLKGYTEITDIHLANLPCTDAEKAEIKALLKEGVLL